MKTKIFRFILGNFIGLISVIFISFIDYELTDGLKYTPPNEPLMRAVAKFLDKTISMDVLAIIVPVVLLSLVFAFDLIMHIRKGNNKLLAHSLITLLGCAVMYFLAFLVPTLMNGGLFK